MNMKPEYVNESRWTRRVAPYVLVAGSVGVGVSLVWIAPILWQLVLGLVSGALVLFFHLTKWRTGRERFQAAAMAAGFLPVFIFERIVIPRVGNIM